jgi:hypothetical protein
MSMSGNADAPPSRRDTIGTVALIAAILGVFGLICLPTRIQDLAPALRAKFSHGITGTFRLDEYRSGKTGYWHGEFRSHDGRVVIRSTKLDGLPGSTPAGSNVPAFIVTTRHTFWGPPTAYTGKNSNYLWLPVLATLYWSSLIVAGTIWIRIVLRRRRLKRFPPPPPRAHLPPPDPGNVRAIGMRLRRPRIEHPRDE